MLISALFRFRLYSTRGVDPWPSSPPPPHGSVLLYEIIPNPGGGPLSASTPPNFDACVQRPQPRRWTQATSGGGPPWPPSPPQTCGVDPWALRQAPHPHPSSLCQPHGSIRALSRRAPPPDPGRRTWGVHPDASGRGGRAAPTHPPDPPTRHPIHPPATPGHTPLAPPGAPACVTVLDGRSPIMAAGHFPPPNPLSKPTVSRAVEKVRPRTSPEVTVPPDASAKGALSHHPKVATRDVQCQPG